tara:strand:- start:44 stop:823 length:780 start_codon:yes stop_codon:yes gene_type:complete
MTKAIIYDLSKLDPSIRHDIEKGKYRSYFTTFPDKLLSISQDTKTVKGLKLGYLTGIMYLSPAKLSGINVCPMHEIAGCSKACLNTAGRGQMGSVQMSRLRKTLFMQQFFAQFEALLCREIEGLQRKAAREGLTPLVRLNGTSDILWEKETPWLFSAFPGLQYYDYTKYPNRKTPSNYDLTFSYSGVKKYQPIVKKALKNGNRVAVVFRTQESIPKRFMGMAVVGGDNSDVRHEDPEACVVALYAKGDARQDQSGFVVG